MLSFKVTKKERDWITRIASRALALAQEAGQSLPGAEMEMDLTAAHANGCPLRLEELLAAPDFDLAHDVFGIRSHLNRQTGKLEDCFVPRFAR